ncbi:hypothetical protein NLU13_6126 [Sarocladium strictum]|uniref:separase n=1 Tax=Sarocladium strictum TaxID=5046 RepID=A0AA39GGW2_SARSR|nr:hypothetical protein NLU13_6126 [Sarocladium strictum]
MTTAKADLDAIKAAVSSTSTCTPATIVALKELLLAEEAPAVRPKARSATTTTTSRSASSRSKAQSSVEASSKPTLSLKERIALATHVINATVKSLGEAAKPTRPATPAQQLSNEDLARTPSRRRSLQRSISTPLSPIHHRQLNRVATSPVVTTKSGAKAALQTQATRCLATVECARVAFATLRAAKGPIKADQTDFQLEQGIVVLAGKLTGLGLHEQAIKELRTLQKRLDIHAPELEADPNPSVTADKSTVADLLNYHGTVSRASLPIVTACQIQLLKWVAATKKPGHIESLLEYLREAHTNSPLNLLQRQAKENEKETAKAARSMAALSQALLAMAPSVSSAEDAVAVEPRLSASPEVAFELQTLAFRTQLRWWTLAGHKGNVDDELLTPFSRCMRAFVRRHKGDQVSTYESIASAYQEIVTIITSQGRNPGTCSKGPTAAICNILGTTAQTARRYDDAYNWFQKLQIFNAGDVSSVASCSLSARILSVALKRPMLDPSIEQCMTNMIDSLDGALSGTASELNDLFESISLCRRSVVGLLMSNWTSKSSDLPISDSLKGLLKTFVTKYPRFIRRWLGSPPRKDASAKHLLQFDQRRQILAPLMGQILDATLAVVKVDLDAATAKTWLDVDEVLQECLCIIDAIHDPAARTDHLALYTVKISNLYFSKFLRLRKEKEKSKESSKMLLQSLNRSIDAVKDRSPSEKEKGQLSTKLELLADLCKRGGRSEDAIGNLRSICTNMVEAGILSRVAALLGSQPPALAWTSDENAATLSRTLRSIAKLDKSWNDWTFFLPEMERAAVVEHLLHITRKGPGSGEPLKLHDPAMAALLRLYSLERFPLRRLRTLLFLFSQSLDSSVELENVTSQIEEVLESVRKGQLAEDSHLIQFSEHLQAYHATLSSMADLNAFPSQGLRDALATWRSQLSSCLTRDDLLNLIDDPEGVLEHLKSMSELANLRGEVQMQLTLSELCIALSKLWEGSSADKLVTHQNNLVSQYVGIGLYAQAAITLKETEEIISQHPEISHRLVAEFHLSQAEYLAGIGRSDEAGSHLVHVNRLSGISGSGETKFQYSLRLPWSYHVQSLVALQTGDVSQALSSIKAGIRMFTHDWNKLEGFVKGDTDASDSSILSKTSNGISDTTKILDFMGPRFWALAPSFLRSLLQISAVYAHIGMYQETLYYAEYAGRIAEGTKSTLYRAQVATWTGTIYSKACKLDKAAALLVQAKHYIPDDICAVRVRLASELAGFYRDLGEEETSAEYFRIAEETAQRLNEMQKAGVAEEQQEVKKAVARTTAAVKTTRGTRAATRTTTTTAARATRRAAATKPKSTASVPTSDVPQDLYRSSLTASVALSRALSFVQQRDWEAALTSLAAVRDMPKLLSTLSQEQIITATSLIGQSMELMIKDPVFSVMQDSTISFPATSAASAKAAMERLSPAKSPPAKSRVTTVARKGAKESSPVPLFANALVRAQELLLEAHSTGMTTSDSAMVHRISALLQSTVIMLSATSATRAMTGSSPAFATVAAELARNVVWKRELMALKATSTPVPYKKATAPRRSSLGLVSDMTRLQTSYIEMLPKNWSVISMSLSDNRHDLYITKFQSGHSPFVLRLPLERANSRDVDSGIFNFEHGHEELLDIIKHANETCHSAKNFHVKGERTAWWEEREALDERLKELLETIEGTWLGGFKGIFSQHHRRPDLLARFQKSFQKILDGCLPSRNNRMAHGKKPAKSHGVVLDPRILDLFIGLGDPSEPTNDFDEALNDLLYFVVDILQFHGERNAYDEIDFDAMVVETYDALRGYYAALNRGFGREDGAHTILVLDKALHAFPWESMPCMDGLAISRVPSLAYLRRVLTEANKPSTEHQAAGHYVSASKGTYVLNPSSDLKNTQKFFQSPFASQLPSWTSHVNRVPTESDFESALSDSDIFLYFGHGSGAQYVRSSRIRSLERCRPAAFLMGCSSAALSTAGTFECHGPVWNHLVAGCPAVVGTLWDVTDRDIDRFAGRAFEEWGLFEKGTFQDEKKQGRAAKNGVMSVDVSLTEAVARARQVCRFRYLNAAAVVQYGIPVYISQEGERGP